jgi:dipeptidase
VKKVFGILFTCVLVLSLVVLLVPAFADNGGTPADEPSCTNVLVGKAATVDGSTMGAYCCDGAALSEVKVVPAADYPPGTITPIYYRPYPSSYADSIAKLSQVTIKGYIPQVEHTYRFVSLQVYYDGQRCGGMNEYGLYTGETTINPRSQLRNSAGLLSAYTNYTESALMVIALQRAKTAREAIEVIGSLAETYGYAGYGGTYGENITITDGNEAWELEIFASTPSGVTWTPDCGLPGAVWCAERIPDGNAGVYANRSRIDEVPLVENDYFMFSSNTRSLALEKGWWDGTEPFSWYRAYAPSTSVNLREWEVLNLVAPSLHLDPTVARHPFSVPVDHLLSVQDVQAIYRDYYQGTPYDITANAKFLVPPAYTQVSPLAGPFGPSDLYRLLGISATRSVATTSSVFSEICQTRADLPDPIKGCLWYTPGPGLTGCYVPIYSGVTQIPVGWSNTDQTKVDTSQAWWAFNLPWHLALIKWQATYANIQSVRDPAEATFFAQQPDMESAVLDLYAGPRSEVAAEELATKLVTNYTNACMNAVLDGYSNLVTYLLVKYYSSPIASVTYEPSAALPTIDCPPVPAHPVRIPVGR